MSLLSPTSDFTGQMSQADISGQDIQNLQEEITRMQQNQDSINQTLNIVAQGKQSVTGGAGSLTVPLTPNTANTFMVYVAPSDRVGQFYSAPYYEFDTSSAVTVRFVAYSTAASGSTAPGINILYAYPTTATLTFYYFVIQQPANVTL